MISVYRYAATQLRRDLHVVFPSSMARKKARGKPWLSNGYIAHLRIPIGTDISLEKTGKHPAHWMIWENPHVMLDFVEHVEPITLPTR